MGQSDMPAARARPRAARLAGWLLVAYLIVLGLIGFAPDHLDRDLGWLVGIVIRMVPGLTYDNLEFFSNVLLFVPLGVLGALVVRPVAAVPLFGLALSSVIETVQNDFLPGRTGSVLDVVANAAGALIGTAVVVLVRRTSARVSATSSVRSAMPSSSDPR